MVSVSCVCAFPVRLKCWWPLMRNRFNGGKGEGCLKDWLGDLDGHWTNQSGHSQGQSQGPRQTNSSLPQSWTHAHWFSLTHTFSWTQTHLKTSNTSQSFLFLNVTIFLLTWIYEPSHRDKNASQLCILFMFKKEFWNRKFL